MQQVDFIQAYPQADIKYDVYMVLTKGIQTRYGNGRMNVLKLLKIVYEQKQAGRVWSQKLSQGLHNGVLSP
jgi:Reverse transcriptase (RNA-dependent DNA polymerase)